MSSASVRVGVGTRFRYDGETVEVVEMAITSTGNEVVLKDHHGRVMRLAVKELLLSDRAQVIPESPGPSSDDEEDLASVVLAQLSHGQREALLERAAHIREVLTGYRSGSPELAAEGEPRVQYAPDRPLFERYADKAAELGVTRRTIQRWVQGFQRHGEAGLVGSDQLSQWQGPKVDDRWVETALEVMGAHKDESKPSRTLVIDRTRARVIARFGPDAVAQPSRATAFRVLDDLERRHPLFRLSTKRNRDIADRPKQVYGKLRPTRPGEYLVMDTTRLDVFAFDPFTLKWVQAELTVSMDWYDRCICGLRLTPVSTKAVDAAAVLYQSFRPRPADSRWPRRAVWPEHGIPRTVLVDTEQFEGPGLATPPVVPETIVIDHGKIYVSEHLTSVCARMGISIQPARLRTGRDKGPVERFFRTLREDLLQALPGYKGPDIFSRGEKPEDDALFFLDELEAIIREWVATVIVKDKGVHTAIGLAHYKRQGPRKWISVGDPQGPTGDVGLCRACGAVDPDANAACATCGTTQDTGLYRVATVCEPQGFRTNYREPADYDGTYEFTPRAGHARVSLTETLAANAVSDLEFRYGNARILVVNDAGGADFRLARMGGWDGLISTDLVADQERRRELQLPNPPPDASTSIPMALGAWEVTDTLLVGLSEFPSDLDLAPTRLEARAAWTSFGFLLRNAASKLLDIDPSELRVGVFPQPHPEGVTGTAFLADSLANGAGYATYLGQNAGQLLQAAQELAEDYRSHDEQEGGCDSSCYRCLRDHSNAAYHPLLDWRLAVDLLNLGTGEAIDSTQSDQFGELLVQDFCRDFGWEAASAAGVPGAIDTEFGDLALVATHPLERQAAPLPARLAAAEQDLTRQGSGLSPMRVEFVSTYQLVRRPGVVWSRLVSQ